MVGSLIGWLVGLLCVYGWLVVCVDVGVCVCECRCA